MEYQRGTVTITNNWCIKMGKDVSQFMVLIVDGANSQDSTHKLKLCEAKGE